MEPAHRYPKVLRALLVVALVALASKVEAAERDSLKLLTIGNSFSDDAIAVLPALAKAGGKTLVIGRASIGGCSLERHAQNLKYAEEGNPEARAYKNFIHPKSGEKGDVTLVEAISAEAWDVVTIQQWSRLSFKPETFEPFAGKLIRAIRDYSPNAEIVVHETWAYREDHSIFRNDQGFTPARMYADISRTYRDFADSRGFRLLPVGDSMHLARQTSRWSYVSDPSFDFKNPPPDQLPAQSTSLNVGWKWTKNRDTGLPELSLDATHCNAAGRYLAACVWYLQLFETDSVPNDYHPEALTPADAVDLRSHALAAVRAERTRSRVASVTRTDFLGISPEECLIKLVAR
jgi:hypothetical protein